MLVTWVKPGVIAMMSSCHKLSMGIMWLLVGTYSIAAETMPVSYPKRNPPIAATNASK